MSDIENTDPSYPLWLVCYVYGRAFSVLESIMGFHCCRHILAAPVHFLSIYDIGSDLMSAKHTSIAQLPYNQYSYSLICAQLRLPLNFWSLTDDAVSGSRSCLMQSDSAYSTSLIGYTVERLQFARFPRLSTNLRLTYMIPNESTMF